MERRTSFVRRLRRDSAALQQVLGLETRGASATAEGKLKRRKMRAVIVIIVLGQLFPRWSKSC